MTQYHDPVDDEEVGDVSQAEIAAASTFLQTCIVGQYKWQTDDNLLKTPERFARMFRELTTAQDFEFTVFQNTNPRSEMVVEHEIPFVSLCSHHVVPFMGKAWIGYIPDKKIVGLSKLARSVHFWAAGLWTQEELTHSISAYLEDQLAPLGVAVVMKAEHLCMTIRGAKTPGAMTTTSSMRGVFLDPPPGRDPKAEFMALIQKEL